MENLIVVAHIQNTFPVFSCPSYLSHLFVIRHLLLSFPSISTMLDALSLSLSFSTLYLLHPATGTSRCSMLFWLPLLFSHSVEDDTLFALQLFNYSHTPWLFCDPVLRLLLYKMLEAWEVVVICVMVGAVFCYILIIIPSAQCLPIAIMGIQIFTWMFGTVLQVFHMQVNSAWFCYEHETWACHSIWVSSFSFWLIAVILR